MSALALPLIHGVALKLAALLYRKSLLGWRDAVSFGMIDLPLLFLGALLSAALGPLSPGPVLVVAIGLLVQRGLGSWYLSP